MEAFLWDLKPLDDQLSLFQLQIIVSIHERPLQATIAAPTLQAAAVREPTLLFVTENGFWSLTHCAVLCSGLDYFFC